MSLNTTVEWLAGEGDAEPLQESCSLKEQHQRARHTFSGPIKDRLDGFHDVKEPMTQIQSENHRHRLILYLAAQGLRQSEICAEMGMTPVWVSNVMRQSWFVEGLARLLETRNISMVDAMLERGCAQSVETLIELRDSKATPPSVKSQICFGILDRVFGKPVQKVVTESVGPVAKSSDDVDELRKQEAALAEQERLLTGGGNS